MPRLLFFTIIVATTKKILLAIVVVVERFAHGAAQREFGAIGRMWHVARAGRQLASVCRYEVSSVLMAPIAEVGCSPSVW